MNRPGATERDAELDRALRRLQRGEDPARVLGELSLRLMNKLIHGPTRELRRAAGKRS